MNRSNRLGATARRDFLRLGLGGLMATWLQAAGCGRRTREDEGPVTKLPAFRPFGGAMRSPAGAGAETRENGRTGEPIRAVRIVDPSPSTAFATIAYASRATRRVYVDPEFRDSARATLEAHISVSTGRWRIRAPDDPPKEPLVAGVPEREFEETAAPDPARMATPAPGDVRVLLTTEPVEVSYQRTCAEIPGLGWLCGGPWRAVSCAASEAGVTACREDLLRVGVAALAADATICASERVSGGCRSDPGRDGAMPAEANAVEVWAWVAADPAEQANAVDSRGGSRRPASGASPPSRGVGPDGGGVRRERERPGGGARLALASRRGRFGRRERRSCCSPIPRKARNRRATAIAAPRIGGEASGRSGR